MVDSTYEAGRTVLALDFMVFTLRLIHIFAIHKQLGPKIIIVERMVMLLLLFLLLFTVMVEKYDCGLLEVSCDPLSPFLEIFKN